jgi:HAD superfamily hydrolase (TIGR01450 family)
MPASLRTSAEALASDFDVALLDLDGVVYVGRDAVPGAADALRAAREQGMRLAFVTNNAARPPSAVAAHLTELGIAADPAEVITSSQAAAHYLAERLPGGANVLVVGTTGLVEALRERGLTPVFSADDDPAAVVQGYSPDLDWHQLAEGAVVIRRGRPWIATNLDPTVPSPRGPLPGNGSLVAALRHATGVTPVATGKPDPTMHRESVERSAAHRPIVVGDRLDTDVEGARRVGCPSLLVLTGVTTPLEVITASEQLRPDFVGADLSALLHPHPAPSVDGARARCGAWSVEVDGDELRLAGGDDDRAAVDDLDPFRALIAAAWAIADRGENAPRDWRFAADGAATEALRRLDLA